MRFKLLALLLVWALLLGCSWKEKPDHHRIAHASFDLGQEEPVRVGYELRATVEGGTDGGPIRVHTHRVPYCASARVGTTTYQQNAVYKADEQQVRTGKTVSIVGLVVTALGAVVVAATGLNDPRIWGLVAANGVVSGMFLAISLTHPDKKEEAQPPKTERVALVSSAGWEPCGEPEPVSQPVYLRFRDGSRSFRLDVQTGNDGIYRTDTSLLKDLYFWADACRQEITVQTGFYTKGDAKIYHRQQGIERARDARPGRRRGPYGLEDYAPDNESNPADLELGSHAGKPSDSVWASSSTQTLSIPAASSVGTPSRTTKMAAYGEICAQRQRDNARQRCQSDIKAATEKTCQSKCTDARAEELCSVKRETCNEMTAGIGGTLADECAAQERACLKESGQTPERIKACVNRCVQNTYREKCGQ